MGKKVQRKNVVIFSIILFVVGFMVGQFFHIPAFDDYNMLDAMRRPGVQHNRR